MWDLTLLRTAVYGPRAVFEETVQMWKARENNRGRCVCGLAALGTSCVRPDVAECSEASASDG
jgi:hypothetical protein